MPVAQGPKRTVRIISDLPNKALNEKPLRIDSLEGEIEGEQSELIHFPFYFSPIGADLVTEYDRAVEKMISTSLKEKYPNYM